jgi:GAF domain-containing protein
MTSLPPDAATDFREENARLKRELREARDRQAGSAEVLRTIASASGDAERALQQVAETTARLFGASSVTLLIADGDRWGRTIRVGAGSERIASAIPLAHVAITSQFMPGVVYLENRQVHVSDIEDPAAMARWPGLAPARAAGTRTMSGTPLRREGRAIGALIVHRDRPEPFTGEELALQQSFADQAVIAIENARLFNETREALERQAATASILQVIASSASDVQPVFDAVAERAMSLLDCWSVIVTRFDGEHIKFGAARGALPDTEQFVRQRYKSMRPDRTSMIGRSLLERAVVNCADAQAEPDPGLRDYAHKRGLRAVLVVPLLREDRVEGALVLTRAEPGLFAPREIELVQTFADQAVIAIENAQLFNETKEALERQTATADILKVIASSPSDVQPVFEAIAASANRLIGGFSTAVLRFVGDELHLAAFTPIGPKADEALKSSFPRPLAEFPPFVLVRDGATQQFTDTEAEDVSPLLRDLARLRGYRSMLFTPLMSNDRPIGMISVTRKEPGTFAAHHIQLVRTFADQAVIAIENVRLFDEVQAKTRDLTESLQQQTATADVLKVISRSVFDLQTVLDTLVESAYRLCGARLGLLYLRGDEAFECRAVAGEGVAEASLLFKGRPIRAGRGTAAERVIMTGEVHSVTDFFTDPDLDPKVKELIRNAAPDSGFAELRSTLAVPMTRDGVVIGVMVIARTQTGPFPARQVELLRTFADQAVIAIENARLFDEVQARTRDLTESLQQQTATSEVLKVISRSAFDLQAVFDTLISSAVELSGAFNGTICLREGEGYRYFATAGIQGDFRKFLLEHPPTPGRGSVAGRVLLSGNVESIPDVLEDPEYVVPASTLNKTRSVLGVPLLRNDRVEGTLVLARIEPVRFSERQIELVQTFADQAVIAIENVRLFDEVQARTRELAASLHELRTAQDRLVQTEKLASLGQLTAGIAHEIKNPLNFVNNFSALSAELTDELNDVLKPAPLDDKIRQEVNELTHMLKDNLTKVVQHGKRADSIVKNMLLHSREGSGEHRPADINALVDESLNLAYHGARAERQGFNVTLQRDFDPAAGMVELFPQEITRVFLNLIANGFYAVTKRKAEIGNSGFEPLLRAATRNLGEAVEVRIRDNGTGIPAEVREKMFNPFFTTKPAGEGTGLGLSMSHDIVVKQHGGTIEVDTALGQYTEFRIVLPRTSNQSSRKRGQP